MTDSSSSSRSLLDSRDDRWSQLDVVLFTALSAITSHVAFSIISAIQYAQSPQTRAADGLSSRANFSNFLRLFSIFGGYGGFIGSIVVALAVGYRVLLAVQRASKVAAENDDEAVLIFVWHLLRVSRFSRWVVALFVIGLIGSALQIASLLYFPANPQGLWDVGRGGLYLVLFVLWACALWAALQMNKFLNTQFNFFDDAGELEMPAGTSDRETDAG